MQSELAVDRGESLSFARSFIVTLALLCFLLPTALLADDYLSELEAEAESSASGATDDDVSSMRSGAIGGTQRGSAAQASFEQALELGRPHVYIFYQRLTAAEKWQVVMQYNNDAKNMSKAANQVLDLYFQKK